ncbi:MAG: MptD family putative ECF transporter S component, partial [Lactobacillus iners]|nr:MptD family putative ECF transporter S component [Lactobacillus iners]
MSLFLDREQYFVQRASFGQAYADAVSQLMPNWMAFVLLIVCFICGILGGLLFQKILKKLVLFNGIFIASSAKEQTQFSRSTRKNSPCFAISNIRNGRCGWHTHERYKFCIIYHSFCAAFDRTTMEKNLACKYHAHNRLWL